MTSEDEQLEKDLEWLRKAQAEIVKETEGMTPEEEVAYYREQEKKARQVLGTPAQEEGRTNP